MTPAANTKALSGERRSTREIAVATGHGEGKRNLIATQEKLERRRVAGIVDRTVTGAGKALWAVYAHAMRFSDDERAHLKALVEGREWAPAGTNASATVPEASAA